MVQGWLRIVMVSVLCNLLGVMWLEQGGLGELPFLFAHFSPPLCHVCMCVCVFVRYHATACIKAHSKMRLQAFNYIKVAYLLSGSMEEGSGTERAFLNARLVLEISK